MRPSPQKTQGPRGKETRSPKSCYHFARCHSPNKCPYIKERCYYCDIIGHSQRTCRKKQAIQKVANAGMNVMEDADSEKTDGKYGEPYHVSSGWNRKPITLNVYLEGRTVPMELDTGSSVSVMSEGGYGKSLRHIPLKDTPMKLRTYTGKMVKPMGFCYVTEQYNGQSKELPIYITKNEGPSLFGREWLESIQLNWPLLQLETSDVITALDEVLSKYESVFSEGLGKMKNIQA